MKIVVLANVRTGSTALCSFLSKIYKANDRGEYFHADYYHPSDEFVITQLSKSNKRFVVKVMPYQIVEPHFSNLVNSVDKIYGIYRQDVVAQIASFYIADKRQRFQFTRNTAVSNDNYIECNKSDIVYYINKVKQLNSIYATKFRPLCDIEYAYENVLNMLSLSDFRQSDRPINYDEVVELVKKYID